jgi:hypothetical protein
MRKLAVLLAIALIGFSTSIAQEELEPIHVGGGQVATRVVNGQTLEISASGVSAIVYWNEVSSQRVTGVAVRSSGGTSAGTVTIRWANRSRNAVLTLGPTIPSVIFGMEGGDVDKRSGNDNVSPLQ